MIIEIGKEYRVKDADNQRHPFTQFMARSFGQRCRIIELLPRWERDPLTISVYQVEILNGTGQLLAIRDDQLEDIP
jgi:hypothetical protein